MTLRVVRRIGPVVAFWVVSLLAAALCLAIRVITLGAGEVALWQVRTEQTDRLLYPLVQALAQNPLGPTKGALLLFGLPAISVGFAVASLLQVLIGRNDRRVVVELPKRRVYGPDMPQHRIIGATTPSVFIRSRLPAHSFRMDGAIIWAPSS